MKTEVLFFFVLIICSGIVYAHETREYEIGSKKYKIVVGSLGEPIVVDAKTGVDLNVQEQKDGKYVPIDGLEDFLKVELIADGKKKVRGLEGQYNQPGKYKADFIPTVEGKYSYRIFGELNKVPIDLTFSCNEHGHHVAGNDVNSKRIVLTEGVTQIIQRGAFGCPTTSSEIGFPLQTTTLNRIEVSLHEHEANVRSSNRVALGAHTIALVSLGISIIALLLAAACLIRLGKASK